METLIKKVDFMVPEHVELHSWEWERGKAIASSLFGTCVHLSAFSLYPVDPLLTPLCSHDQALRRTSRNLVFQEIILENFFNTKGPQPVHFHNTFGTFIALDKGQAMSCHLLRTVFSLFQKFSTVPVFFCFINITKEGCHGVKQISACIIDTRH